MNHEKKELTDIRIKLVGLSYESFNDESGWYEVLPISIGRDNRLFDIGENIVIPPDDNAPIILARVDGLKLFLLLKKRTYETKRLLPHKEQKHISYSGKWTIAIDVGGRISGVPFQKERFMVTISSFIIESFADSGLENSISIDMKGDVIHVKREDKDEQEENE